MSDKWFGYIGLGAGEINKKPFIPCLGTSVGMKRSRHLLRHSCKTSVNFATNAEKQK